MVNQIRREFGNVRRPAEPKTCENCKTECRGYTAVRFLYKGQVGSREAARNSKNIAKKCKEWVNKNE